MPLQEMYYIAEMVVGVAVIISIVFVALELRQNRYLLRHSMADGREQRFNWLMETLCTDEDFREFFQRTTADYDALNDSDKFRALSLGIRQVRPMLNELVAHFDGKLLPDEFESLKHNIRQAKARPHIVNAYQYTSRGFPKKVRDFWDEFEADTYPIASKYLSSETQKIMEADGKT